MIDDVVTKTPEGPRTLGKEVFKWFGIIGTAFTIFSNAGTFIDFSRFIKHWTDQWRELITALLNFVAQFFSITLDESTAVIVFAVISCVIVSLSAQGHLSEPWSAVFRIFSCLMAAFLSAIYFCFVMLGPSASDPRMESEIYQYSVISFIVSLAAAALVFIKPTPERDIRLWRIGIAIFFIVLIVGPITEFGAASWIRDNVPTRLPEWFFFGMLASLVVTMYFISQPITIAFRSVGILIILCCLIGLNLFARFIEYLGWGA